MTRFAPLAMLWLVLPAGPCSGQQDELVSAYTQAQAAQQAGDYKTASEKYERIVQLRPEMAEAHANLGMLYFLQNRDEEAKPRLQRAIQLKATLPGPHFFLGLIAFRVRDYSAALSHLKQGEALDPRNITIQAHLGYTNYALANHQEAVRYLELAALNAERDQDIYYNLSNAYGHLAMAPFASLQEKHPNAFLTFLARAHYYEAQQNWEAAKIQYMRAAESDPANRRVQARLQWVTAQAENKPAAPPAVVPGFDPADGSLPLLYAPPSGAELKSQMLNYRAMAREVETHPESVEKLFKLGEYYQILCYLTSLWAVEIDPNSYRAHHLKGRYFEAMNKDEDAISEYRRALELNPKLPNIHFLLGNLFWLRERHEEALPELQAELKVNPNYPPALYEIGDILYTAGKWQEAEKYYLQAVKYDPKMAEAHLALERIYGERGEFEKALHHLRTVSAMAPEDATPHYRLSIIYRKMNRPELAQKELATFQQLKAKEKSPHKIVGANPDKPKGKPVQ